MILFSMTPVIANLALLSVIYCTSRTICLKCKTGYKGPICSEKCSNCKEETECEKDNGYCKGGCKEMLSGDYCNNTCSKKCRTCKRLDNEKCIECAHNLHGDECSMSCPSNCLNEHCEDLSGKCALGCKSGFWGDVCQYSCAVNCTTERCHWTNGTCLTEKNVEDSQLFKFEYLLLLLVLVPVVLVICICACICRKRNSEQTEDHTLEQKISEENHEDAKQLLTESERRNNSICVNGQPSIETSVNDQQTETEDQYIMIESEMGNNNPSTTRQPSAETSLNRRHIEIADKNIMIEIENRKNVSTTGQPSAEAFRNCRQIETKDKNIMTESESGNTDLKTTRQPSTETSLTRRHIETQTQQLLSESERGKSNPYRTGQPSTETLAKRLEIEPTGKNVMTEIESGSRNRQQPSTQSSVNRRQTTTEDESLLTDSEGGHSDLCTTEYPSSETSVNSRQIDTKGRNLMRESRSKGYQCTTGQPSAETSVKGKQSENKTVSKEDQNQSPDTLPTYTTRIKLEQLEEAYRTRNITGEFRHLTAVQVKKQSSLNMVPEAPDELNARYIAGYRKEKKYIISHEPKFGKVGDSTYVAMYRKMIWQTSCYTIVVLTNKSYYEMSPSRVWQEKTKYDSHSSWGSDEIVVDCWRERPDRTSKTYSEFALTLSKYLEEKEVGYYECYGWPETGIPRELSVLVAFTETFKSAVKDSEGPVLVQCSNDIGSTGLFVALDMLIEEAKDGNVDIYGCVKKLREQCSALFRFEDQYRSLYEALIIFAKKSRPRHAV